MIEFFSKKRMIIAIGILIAVSVLVLVLESNMSSYHPTMKNASKSSDNLTKNCWEAADVKLKIEEDCRPCTSYETRVHTFCRETGYRELVTCTSGVNDSKTVYRRCIMTWHEERSFWIFELVAAAVGLGAYGVVFVREKRLDRLLLEKVNKQIAAGI